MKTLKMVIMSVFLVFVLVSSINAVPRRINIQGRLTGPDMAAAENFGANFYIYDSASGGTVLFQQLLATVPLNSGVFNYILGTDANPVPEFLGNNCFLQIELLSAGPRELAPTMLEPRQQLVAVPFAITARNVSGGRVASIIQAGENNKLLPAVQGSNNRSEGRDDLTALNPGVWGTSIAGHGVIGWIANPNKAGVYGYNGIPTVGLSGPGVKGEGRPGVLGSSVAGNGVEGNSTNYIGVTGNSINGFGVQGTYNVATVLPLTIGILGHYDMVGVYGSSKVGVKGVGTTTGGSFEGFDTGGVGVRGSGAAAGGIFESSGGQGVFGKTTANQKAGVYGEGSGNNGQGILGVHTGNGHGIYGKTSDTDNKAGVVGEGPYRGVWGTSSAGIGVYGNGGSGIDSHGVVGAAEGITTLHHPDHRGPAGVFGESQLAGVIGRSDWENGFGVLGYNSTGIGVKAKSDASNKAALFCENLEHGPALEISRGKIKIGAAMPGNENAPVGTVTLPIGTWEQRINNTYATSDSIILLTCQNGWWRYGISEKGAGYFIIHVVEPEGSYAETDKTFGYLIIN
ncbi:MAG: hypothetical protein PHH60_02210 [Candidatus Margulisbacteria bacterium]|nr:hypothetical protein [Candidatus Margulisiibacteriota bacterium]